MAYLQNDEKQNEKTEQKRAHYDDELIQALLTNLPATDLVASEPNQIRQAYW